MLKISRLADYGMVLMDQLVKNKPNRLSASCLSGLTQIPLPTVSKLLKMLSEAKLVHSMRGTQGGYFLERSAEGISVAEVLAAIDGEFALTECSLSDGNCSLMDHCGLKSSWQPINDAVKSLLSSISLADMKQPLGIS